MFSLLIFTFSIIGFALADNSPEPLIVGGAIAAPDQFPYMASIRGNGAHFCGGSILNNRWILTAAHCLESITELSPFEVVVGTNSLKLGGASYKIEEIVLHNNYISSTYLIKNDIGLIKVTKPILFDIHTQPVNLCYKDTPSNTLAVLSGWGLLKPGDTVLPSDLQYLEYRTVNWVKCFLSNFPAIVWCNFICAQATTNAGACSGDSGGPLVTGGKQIGILSWNKGCAVGKPDVYINVCRFSTWIQKRIG